MSERWLSGILGGLLLLGGLRRGMGGTVLGLAAGLLVSRAATGRCACYQLLGIETASAPHRLDRPSTRRLAGRRDIVEEASEESFPASDAPAFTTTIIGPPEHR